MAMQKAKSGLLGKLGKRLVAAHQQHKDAETVYSSMGELPPGVSGIAQLVDAKFDQYKSGDNKGEYYFYAAGVVVSPEEFKDKEGNIHDIKGLRTSIMRGIVDNPESKGDYKTVEDCMGWVYNELRKLGIETDGMEVEDLEGTVAGLVETAPYFKFRTNQGKVTPQYPDPKTFHSWNGVTEYNDPNAEGTDGIEEEPEAPAKPVNRIAAKAAVTAPAKPTAAAKPSANGNGKTKPGKKLSPEPEPEPEEFNEFGDLESLVSQAEADDDDAQQQLTDLAVKAGMTEKEIEKASWQEMADYISSGGEATTEEEEPEPEEEPEESEEPYVPAKEDVVKYKPIDPKTKKPGKLAVECEVLAVNKAKKTVTLKNMDNHKIKYENIGWDKLLPVTE